MGKCSQGLILLAQSLLHFLMRNSRTSFLCLNRCEYVSEREGEFMHDDVLEWLIRKIVEALKERERG